MPRWIFLLLIVSCVRVWGQEKTAPPFYEGLGTHGRAIATSSAAAQRYFDQGLAFLYAFNHDEAIRSFRYARQLDPQCAMAQWGVALANGPHINNPLVTPERAKAAWEALGKARELAAGGNPVERDLIEALRSRYAEPQPEDRKPLDEAYAAAMRKVYQAHAGDADVGALFAEALMDLRPWDLWTAPGPSQQGQAQEGTEEIVATLEAVLAKSLNHPLALHLYIHAVEASPNPEKAKPVADRLRDLAPGLGHLVHMPSHIDVRLGHWQESIEANRKAADADRRYRERSAGQDFYRVYMAHNHHMLAYSAMMCGQSKLAITAINEMAGSIPASWLKENAAVADGFAAMPLEVLMRFGRWNEVLAAPEPPEYLPIARALRRAARAIAFAAQDEFEKATAEQWAFQAARKNVAEEDYFGNNTAADLLAIAELLLDGEILARSGQTDAGIAKLRAAAEREDKLRYSEPPDWIHPIRHALGATLLAANRSAEAEQVYREDLVRQPNNGWSLFGLAKSLHLQNKHDEAKQFDSRFQEVWKNADIQITSSCFCQPQ